MVTPATARSARTIDSRSRRKTAETTLVASKTPTPPNRAIRLAPSAGLSSMPNARLIDQTRQPSARHHTTGRSASLDLRRNSRGGSRFAGSLPGRGPGTRGPIPHGDDRQDPERHRHHGKPARGRNHKASKGPAEKFQGRLLKDRDDEREQEQHGTGEQEPRSFRLTREEHLRSDEKRQEVVAKASGIPATAAISNTATHEATLPWGRPILGMKGETWCRPKQSPAAGRPCGGSVPRGPLAVIPGDRRRRVPIDGKHKGSQRRTGSRLEDQNPRGVGTASISSFGSMRDKLAQFELQRRRS